MKKIIIYAAILAGFAIQSCQRFGMDDAAEESFSLTVNVDGINTGVEAETRALAETVEGESNIANLHLLFFEHSTDGKGKFVYDYVIETPVAGSPITLKIGGRLNEKLSNSKDYSILAFANMDEYMDVNGFTALLTDAPEDEVMKRLPELKNFEKFQLKSLPMSGTSVKKAGQQLVELNLTRAVSRFDVYNSVSDKYDLVSVSIFNAAKKTRIWDGDFPIVQSYTDGKFYGLKPENPVTKIMGSLYAFENSVGDPAKNHDGTTALVIGLKKISSDDAQPMYYRVGIHPDGSGQNLVRNHVYKVTVNAVLKAGATSEAEAETGGLDAVINNWDLDEDGMVVTDGQNIMAIPSKYIRFGPGAESLAYDIYTHGEGTLGIITTEFPDWLTVKLDGNRLTVAVDEWPSGDERGGTVELGFGPLRGKVEIVQSPASVEYLRVTPGTVPMFDAMREDRGQTVSVSASGPWKAVIYNPVEGGLGFSFAGGGTENLEYESGEDGAFDVYTLRDNPKNDILRGFIVVSLVDNPEYKQVVMLMQDAKTPIRISPSYDGFHFDVRGLTIEKADDRYVIDVQPMYDKNGTLRPWKAELTGGGDVQFFELIKDPADPYKLELVAKGNNKKYPGYNLTENELSNVNLRIGIDGLEAPEQDVDYILLPVKQDKLIFSVEQVGGLDKIPVKGSKRNGVYQDYVEYTVTLNPQLKCKAEITKQSHGVARTDKPWTEHKGFFIDKDKKAHKDEGSISLVAAVDGKVRIGFEKIYYPLINETPELTFKVSIVELADYISAVQELNVTQEKLLPRLVKILDARNTNWGSIAIGAYFTYYADYLKNSQMYGNSGTVKAEIKYDKQESVATVIRPISKDYTYIHVGGNLNDGFYTETHHQAIVDWWKTNNKENPVVYVGEERAGHHKFLISDQADKTRTVLKELGYHYNIPGNDGRNAKINLSTTTNLMKYLTEDGPFSFGAKIDDFKSLTFNLDGYSTGVDAIYSKPLTEGGAVSVIQHQNGIPMLVIDPKNNLIFIGDSQFFHSNGTGSNRYNDPPVVSNSSLISKFLANVLSYIIHSAQYGSHFTDMFVQLKSGDPEYDAKTQAEREQRYEYSKKFWLTNPSE